jgi:hypothetical protein
MAATATLDAQPDGRSVSGSSFIRQGTLSLGVYATGGVAVSRTTFDLPCSLRDLRVDSAGGYVFAWDRTNAKVLAYRQKDPAAAGGADIALPEVGDTVDISAVSARFRATGT